MRTWELHAEITYDVEIINPFYDITRKDILGIDEGREGRYEKLDPAEVVFRDLKAIKNSDGVIAYVNGDLSYGTIMEIVYAYGFKIPVYTACTNGHEKHPWLDFHSDQIFTSLIELEENVLSL